MLGRGLYPKTDFWARNRASGTIRRPRSTLPLQPRVWGGVRRLLPDARAPVLFRQLGPLAGASPLLSSRLSHIISANSLANSYMSFSTSNSDTGLWGIYFVSENLVNLDDLMHFTLRERTRMSTAPTGTWVERAKRQPKAMLFDGTSAVRKSHVGSL